MTTVINTATSSIVSMATDDVIYVTQSGSILKTSGGAAIMSSSAVPVLRASVVIDGLVARLGAPATGFTAAVIATAHVDGSSGNNSFSIGTTGVVRSNTDGFLLRDVNDSVQNLGLIDVTGDAIAMDRGGSVTNGGTMLAANAVIIDGASANIRNLGTISATETAITSQAQTGTVFNAGSITARQIGVSLEGGAQSLINTGTITGGSAAVSVTGLTSGRIESSGTLHATALTGTGLLIAGSNGLVIDLSGSIHAGANGIFAETSTALRLIQAADISAGLFGIKMTGANDFRLDNSGQVTAGTAGMSLAGNNVVLANSGQIHGLAGDGVQAQGAVFTLRNTGTIEGSAAGMTYAGSLLTGGALVLDNGAEGVIHGGLRGVVVGFADLPGPSVQAQIHNAGEISGSLAGIQITGLPMVLHNSGTIFAASGPAILAGGEQNMRIFNSGVIEAALPLISGDAIAVNLAGAAGGGVNLLQNNGQIVGSVIMGDQVSAVRNRGLVSGDVNLGAGNDSYDGRGGEVSGTVLGLAGNDQLAGGAGNDALSGGEGMDRLRGGAGEDALSGGLGRDLLTGGGGADSFVFGRAIEVSAGLVMDQILDFQSGADRIEFGFGPAQTFIGAAEFGNVAGEIRYVRATGIVQGDMNGDGKADFALMIVNHALLTAEDFGL